jgi:hypothetical protein
MNGKSEDKTSRNGAILPPVITRRAGIRAPSTASPATPIVPPFVAGKKSAPVELPVEVKPPIEATVQQEANEEMPWDSISDEGVVEPVFQADTDAVLEALTEQADAAKREEFPLDAFIVPEEAHRVPNGMEGKPVTAAPETTPLSSLAERLEKLSHKLRIEDTDEVIRRLASGDRLDALLGGLVAGYLAGSSDHKA